MRRVALFAATSVLAVKQDENLVQLLKHRLAESSSRRQLTESGFTDDETTRACESKIYAYNQCTGVTDEPSGSYYFDDTYYYADDPTAECAYLLNGGSCVELVDDGDVSCTKRFYESVECYYSAVCGRPVKCDDDADPFATELKPITFYNVYPSQEAVCFFFGNFLEHSSGPLSYGEAVTMDVVADETLFVGYGRTDGSDCNGVTVENSHSLGVYVSDVNTYGVGVLEDGTMGPKAWRSEIASDPDSTIFVHEAKGFTECYFDMTAADLGLAVQPDDGVAQDLKCADYRASRGHVSATCDGQDVEFYIDPSAICARAAQQFMTIGDKDNPDAYPLQLFLVQANQRCDYLCGADTYQAEDDLSSSSSSGGGSPPTANIDEDDDDDLVLLRLTSQDKKKSSSQLKAKNHLDDPTDDDPDKVNPARSIVTISIVSMVAGLCCGCALALLAIPFWRRQYDDDVEINKAALRQPLLQAEI